ncbi:hypothetical protein HSR122_1184 [Halapricum desulfuricans]|uniref:Uncharacterized protein n=1 Tax=Halapricum desulfuricans TaxID=2841257 RepID=A0A897NBX5_9EURY|nr:hypothetical protein HSR122_1184 [Halapricum desulfuricans]
MAGVLPRLTLLETSEGVASHQANIEGVGLVPAHEPLRDVSAVETAGVDETAGDPKREFGIVGDRAGRLPVTAVAEH